MTDRTIERPSPDLLSKRCFRCGGIYKLMLNIKIDDNTIPFCASCYRDFTLFMDGYEINPMVSLDRKNL